MASHRFWWFDLDLSYIDRDSIYKLRGLFQLHTSGYKWGLRKFDEQTGRLWLELGAIDGGYGDDRPKAEEAEDKLHKAGFKVLQHDTKGYDYDQVREIVNS